MLANLLRPFILARLSLSLAATAACVIGLFAAVSLMRTESLPLGHPLRIAAERKAELVSALIQTALAASALGVFTTMVGAERAHHEIRGAMCAYGVLASTEHGFGSLVTATVAALACSAWLALHRLDLQLETPTLTRTKLLALFAVFPALAFDLVTASRFALELDFTVVATCCSSGLDAAGPSIGYGASRAHVFPITLGLGLSALLASVALVRRPNRPLAFATATTVLAFAASGVAAAIDVVAPHAYGQPMHRCAFCLLGEAAHGLGYPLLFALGLAGCLGTALLVIESERSRSEGKADGLERKLARWSAVATLVGLLLLVVPVAVYRLQTGAFVVSPW